MLLLKASAARWKLGGYIVVLTVAIEIRMYHGKEGMVGSCLVKF